MRKGIKLIPFAYLLFRFYIQGISETLQKGIIIGVLLIYLFFNINILVKKNKMFYEKAFCFFLVLLCIVFVAALNMFQDVSFVRKIMSFCLDFLCVISFCVNIYKQKESNKFKLVVDEYCTIIMMYVAFSLLCMIVPQVGGFWKSIIVMSEHDRYMLDMIAKYAGRFGWNGFAGYGATFACSLGIYLAIVYLHSIYIHKNEGSYLKYYSFIIVCLIGNFFYGRIGLVVSALIILMFIAKICFVNGRLGVFVGFFCAGIGALLLLLLLKDKVSLMNSVYNWVFEPILNYLSGNGFSADSLDSLKTMYKLPSFSTFLIGDGFYTNLSTGGYYQSTDVGFLRLIYYWGIIPTVLLYILLINTFKKTFFYNSKFSYLTFVLLFVLFEMKGEVAISLTIYMICFLLLHSCSKPITTKGETHEAQTRNHGSNVRVQHQ